MAGEKVLILGAGGMIGSDLRERLSTEFEVYSGDVIRLEGAPNPVVCDIRDRESVRAACQGMDAIVLLAAAAWEYDLYRTMIPLNIIGPTHVFDAARREGVKRVIFASSHHTISLHHSRDEENLTEETELNPSTFYGVTKVFGEALGRWISERHGIQVFCLRIGMYLGGKRMDPGVEITRAYEAIPLSPRDFAQMVTRCLTVEGVPFAVMNCISKGRRPWLDLTRARELVGYEPEDSFESLFGADAPPVEFDGEEYRRLLLGAEAEGEIP